jgi:putative addiction module component (TIGR02574 family)
VNVAELLALPRDDRAELASMLLESLEPDDGLGEEHLEELRRLLAAYRANPGATYALEDVEAEAFSER